MVIPNILICMCLSIPNYDWILHLQATNFIRVNSVESLYPLWGIQRLEGQMQTVLS
jgi:hypothetical protein